MKPFLRKLCKLPLDGVLVDPVDVVAHSGVHARVFGLGAAAAPRNGADEGSAGIHNWATAHSGAEHVIGDGGGAVGGAAFSPRHDRHRHRAQLGWQRAGAGAGGAPAGDGHTARGGVGALGGQLDGVGIGAAEHQRRGGLQQADVIVDGAAGVAGVLHHLAHLDHRSAAVVRQGVVADVEGAGADAVDAVGGGDDPVGADDGAAAAVRRPLQGDLVRRGAVGRLGAADDVAVGVEVPHCLCVVLLSNRRAEGDRGESGEQEEFHGCWCLGRLSKKEVPNHHHIEGDVGEQRAEHQLANDGGVCVAGDAQQQVVLPLKVGKKAVLEHDQMRLFEGDGQRVVQLGHVPAAEEGDQGEEVQRKEALPNGAPGKVADQEKVSDGQGQVWESCPLFRSGGYINTHR
ncbi:hypothetical protein TYRP_022178 [Tyrophagus putrescentiae]|nr:hypothetical protein TYRP_022178 [Tyrophagus putrescentiae]